MTELINILTAAALSFVAGLLIGHAMAWKTWVRRYGCKPGEHKEGLPHE